MDYGIVILLSRKSNYGNSISWVSLNHVKWIKLCIGAEYSKIPIGRVVVFFGKYNNLDLYVILRHNK